MSDLREQIEAAISSSFDHHSCAWIGSDNKVRCDGCDEVVPPGGIGWHQIEAAAEAVLQIIEPQEATAP